jgi:hypothetical protein
MTFKSSSLTLSASTTDNALVGQTYTLLLSAQFSGNPTIVTSTFTFNIYSRLSKR